MFHFVFPPEADRSVFQFPGLPGFPLMLHVPEPYHSHPPHPHHQTYYLKFLDILGKSFNKIILESFRPDCCYQILVDEKDEPKAGELNHGVVLQDDGFSS